MGHAWVELIRENGEIIVVFDGTLGEITLTKEHYYEPGELTDDLVVRYTYKEVLQHIIKHKHYGPWDPKIDNDKILHKRVS